MAAPGPHQLKKRLDGIWEVLGCLSSSEEQVAEALSDLANVLLHCAESSEDVPRHVVRNSCFSVGIVKAVLGILRSCSAVGLLATASKCLTLLAHGNDEARVKLGELGAILVLLKLLLPRPQGQAGKWPKEWVPVYEQVLGCLRKLTYHNPSNQQQLAVAGGMKLIIEMAMNKQLFTNFGEFPPETKPSLEEMVLRKKLVSRVNPVPKEEVGEVLKSFPALVSSSRALSLHYPAFMVDLVTEDRNSVAYSLLEKGVVWLDHSPLPDGVKWTCVVVQNVEDGCNVWCQFCTSNPSAAVVRMRESLQELAPPDLSMVTEPNPVVGDVYAMFCAAPVVPSHPASPQQWFRGRVLSKKPTLKVLAVDYGFTVTVEATALHPLPFQCRGVPPQAVPCKLRDVAPVPASISLLENAAAVIRNMAFEMVAFRKEIQTFKGIEFLVKLAQTPNKAVVLQALGGLLNMTVSETLREDVGKKGAVKVALGFLENPSCDGDTLEYALGVLLNCCTYCASNTSLVIKFKGAAILKQFKCDEEKTTKEQRERIADYSGRLVHFLACYDETLSKKSPMANGSNSQTPRRDSGGVLGTSADPRKNTLYRARMIANGERAQSRAVVRYLKPETTPTQKDTGFVPVRAEDNGHLISPMATPRSFLLNSSILSRAGSELSRCMFFSVPDITMFSEFSLKKSVCALINTQLGGCVYLGVSKTGVVRGCKVNKEQRDLLCICVDRLMSSVFTPPIVSELYSIRFIPITRRDGSVAVLLKDWFVVELKLRTSYYHQIYTLKERDAKGFKYNRCYYQTSVGLIEKLSNQELRDLLAMEKAGDYAAEVSFVQCGISELREAGRQIADWEAGRGDSGRHVNDEMQRETRKNGEGTGCRAKEMFLLQRETAKVDKAEGERAGCHRKAVVGELIKEKAGCR